MSHSAPRDQLGTHAVTNQPEARGDLDLWGSDPGLQEYAQAFGADAAHLADYGRKMGTTEMQRAGRDANRHKPEAVLFDGGWAAVG